MRTLIRLSLRLIRFIDNFVVVYFYTTLCNVYTSRCKLICRLPYAVRVNNHRSASRIRIVAVFSIFQFLLLHLYIYDNFSLKSFFGSLARSSQHRLRSFDFFEHNYPKTLLFERLSMHAAISSAIKLFIYSADLRFCDHRPQRPMPVFSWWEVWSQL